MFDPVDGLMNIKVPESKQTSSKKVPPLKDNPKLMPAAKMKCIEVLLSDQSITDDERLDYLRNLVLGKNEKAC